MHSGAQYPYYGANGIVDYIDRFLTDCPAVCLAEDCGSYGAGESSAYIITGKAWVNNHAHLLIPTVNHALQYAQTFFQLLDINRFISGTTRSKLTQAQLKKIPFALPGQLEREQFENFVAQIDKLRFDVQRQIEKLETLKKSLMQEYFG